METVRRRRRDAPPRPKRSRRFLAPQTLFNLLLILGVLSFLAQTQLFSQYYTTSNTNNIQTQPTMNTKTERGNIIKVAMHSFRQQWNVVSFTIQSMFLFIAPKIPGMSAFVRRRRKNQRRKQWENYLKETNFTLPQPEHVYMPCLSQSANPETSGTTQGNLDLARAVLADSPSCHVVLHVKVPSAPRRLPPVSKSNRTASLCLFIKNEQLYVNEYVDYHLALGFDEIFIYDNSPDFNLQEWGAVKARETQGRIRLQHSPGVSKQVRAYRMCMRTSIERNHTWMGILDADEMLLLHQHEHVVDLLEEYCSSGVLSIYWEVFGHDYQTRYRPFPLAQRFRYRTSLPNKSYKSFGKLSDIVNADVHFMKVNKTKTDSRGQLITQHDVFGRNLRYSFNATRSDERYRFQANQVASVSHYWLKSVEEWFIKACWRGRPTHTETNRQQKTTKNIQHSNCKHSMSTTLKLGTSTFDDRGWQALKRYVPEYAILDAYY